MLHEIDSVFTTHVFAASMDSNNTNIGKYDGSQRISSTKLGQRDRYCNNFITKGSCPYNGTCKYLHATKLGKSTYVFWYSSETGGLHLGFGIWNLKVCLKGHVPQACLHVTHPRIKFFELGGNDTFRHYLPLSQVQGGQFLAQEAVNMHPCSLEPWRSTDTADA